MQLSRRDLTRLAIGAGAGLALSRLGGLKFGETTVNAAGSMIDLPTGASLYVETQGTGRPVLVIHGGLGLDHTYFQPWLDPLAQQFQLVYPDLRGNGRPAPVAESDYTHEKMIDDLDALRNTLGFKQWIVIGHSYGGFIAQLYAIKYPDTVSQLVLLDTSPASALGNADGAQLVAKKITPEQTAALGKLATVTDDNEWAQIWHTILPLYFYNADVGAAFIASDKTTYRATGISWAAKNLTPTYDTRPFLGQLAMPTLVGVGRYDWITTVRKSEVIYKLIPGSELVIFEQSGHFTFVEEQNKVLETLQRFLYA